MFGVFFNSVANFFSRFRINFKISAKLRAFTGRKALQVKRQSPARMMRQIRLLRWILNRIIRLFCAKHYDSLRVDVTSGRRKSGHLGLNKISKKEQVERMKAMLQIRGESHPNKEFHFMLEDIFNLSTSVNARRSALELNQIKKKKNIKEAASLDDQFEAAAECDSQFEAAADHEEISSYEQLHKALHFGHYYLSDVGVKHSACQEAGAKADAAPLSRFSVSQSSKKMIRHSESFSKLKANLSLAKQQFTTMIQSGYLASEDTLYQQWQEVMLSIESFISYCENDVQHSLFRSTS